ncbi:MAG TPA: PilZ domain-containing protein [Terriglobales bacterium]|nr:PilZ domain-containing protein [Terriglobales bacterium]
MFKERRRAQRFPSSQAIVVSVGNQDEPWVGILENLSITGACLSTDRPIKLHSGVSLILVLPPEITHGQGLRVWCVGTVVRVVSEPKEGKSQIAVDFQKYHVVPEA